MADALQTSALISSGLPALKVVQNHIRKFIR